MTKDIEYLKINGEEVPLVEPTEVIVLTDGNHLQDYSFPIKLTEKTDIEFRAESSSASVNFNVSASLNILYVQN